MSEGKPMKLLRICKKLLRVGKKHLPRLATKAKKVVAETVRSVAEVWRRHLDRLAEEPSYAQALHTVVIAVVELATGSLTIRLVIRALIAAYLDLVRALCRPQIPAYSWDWPADN